LTIVEFVINPEMDMSFPGIVAMKRDCPYLFTDVE
jgi:hypothetical protein